MKLILTEAQCAEFLANKKRNPLTGRAININGPTYRKLLESCKKKVNFASPIVQVQVVKCILVVGLGCNSLSEEDIRNIAKSIPLDTEVMCNMSTGNTMTSIVQSVCYLKPSFKNEFIQSVYKKTKEYLAKGIKVSLVGHSYGGCVVSRIAELIVIESPWLSRNLAITTFGSIYIPDQKDVKDINLVHYMYHHDVALKCNKLNDGEVRSDVKWLRPNLAEPFKKKFTLFGSDIEWAIHNAYDMGRIIMRDRMFKG